MRQDQEFEKRKAESLEAAQKQGIVDVVTGASSDGLSLETVDLATRLMKKHGSEVYGSLASRRAAKK
jgi:hypothetical protein